MRRCDNAVLPFVDEALLRDSIGSPKKENYVLLLSRNGINDFIFKSFPSTSLVRSWLATVDREKAIKEKHALFGPIGQIGSGTDHPHIGRQFFEDILKARNRQDMIPPVCVCAMNQES